MPALSEDVQDVRGYIILKWVKPWNIWKLHQNKDKLKCSLVNFFCHFSGIGVTAFCITNLGTEVESWDAFYWLDRNRLPPLFCWNAERAYAYPIHNIICVSLRQRLYVYGIVEGFYFLDLPQLETLIKFKLEPHPQSPVTKQNRPFCWKSLKDHAKLLKKETCVSKHLTTKQN